MRPPLISIFFCLLLSMSSYASIDTSGLIHFHLKKGLPTNNVYSGLLDRNGYYWFATDHGIVKYNGYTMQVFNAENGSLPSDDVFDMWEDSQGRLWLKSFSDKIGYIKNGKFNEIHYPHGNRSVRVQNFAEYKGIVYFRDEDLNGAYVVFAGDDFLASAFVSYRNYQDRDSNKVFFLSTANDLRFHVWTYQRDLLQLDHHKNRYVKVGKIPEPFTSGFSYGMFSGPTGIISRALTDSGKLIFFDVNTLNYNKLSIYEHGGDRSERIVTYKPYYYPGNYYDHTVIVTNSHLYAFDKEFKFIKREKFSDIVPTSKVVPYQLMDLRSNMWYTSNGDGMWCKPFFYNFYAEMQLTQRN